MNPWGFVVILAGLIVAWVGIRGTQGSLYEDLFGHPYPTNPNSPPWLHTGSAASSGGGSPANPLTPLLPGSSSAPWWQQVPSIIPSVGLSAAPGTAHSVTL